MNILVVSHEFPPIGGGGANACMNLVREYALAGHEVTVLTVDYPDRKFDDCVERVEIIPIHAKRKYLEHCSFVEMWDYMVKALKKMDSIIARKKIDICQVFFAIPSGPIGYYLKKKYKIPYVIRFGGGDIPGFQKRFTVIYQFIAPFETILWKNADVLVANSLGLKRMAENFCDKYDIKIIPNGASEPIKKNVKLEKRDTFRILFVSRLIERKGLQFIIPQLKNIERSCSKDIELIVVGDGPYRTELERLSACYKVESMICFCGQKDKQELPQYYNNADVFILPSQKEGMPNVVLEAMSFGLPIVMTPCEGSQELIDGNGYAVGVEEFAEVLGRLCDDTLLREEMGLRSRDLIREKFNWDSVAKQYLSLFENIVKKL